MNNNEKTQRFGTMTSEGFIEHKRHKSGLMMPVMLKIPERRNRLVDVMGKYLPPLRNDYGRLVYAMPAGESYAQ